MSIILSLVMLHISMARVKSTIQSKLVIFFSVQVSLIMIEGQNEVEQNLSQVMSGDLLLISVKLPYLSFQRFITSVV